MNVDCSIQNCSRGSVTLGDDDDDDNVNNEKSRDQNNMAEPIEVTNNVFVLSKVDVLFVNNCLCRLAKLSVNVFIICEF
jgi:acyl-CoA hydrolase